jgi:Ca2+-binding RTX toxin-like protein
LATSVIRQLGLPFEIEGQYLIGEDLNLPTGSAPRTLIAWVKTEFAGSLSSVAEWGTVDESGGRFGLLLDEAGRLYFSGKDADLVGTKSVNDGYWHKLSVTYDGTNIALYVDGVLDTSAATTSPGFFPNTFTDLDTNGSNLRIGGSALGEQFIGSIKEVSVWDQALSGESLGAPTNNLGGSEPNLVSYYPLEAPVAETGQVSDRDPSGGQLAVVGFTQDPSIFEFGGHYYQVVTDLATWSDALTLAQSESFNGLRGHLATITSAAEQAAIEAYFVANPVAIDGLWLAGSDGQSEGSWIWAAGPEEGGLFWSGDATGGAVSGSYTNWDLLASPPQPNTDANADSEDYLWLTIDANWNNLDQYKWSDAPGNVTAGYLVEYEANVIQASDYSDPVVYLHGSADVDNLVFDNSIFDYKISRSGHLLIVADLNQTYYLGGFEGLTFQGQSLSVSHYLDERSDAYPVNTYTSSAQSLPSVASLPDGGWLVVWQSSGQDGSGYGVYGQRYSESGIPLGAEFRVNSYTTNYQTNPSVAALADGGWVVAWDSDGQDGSGFGVYYRRYAADGTPGSELQVNVYTTSAQETPAVTGLIDGGWLVTWESTGQDGSVYGVYGRRYAADGTPGDEFRLNEYTNNQQYGLSVTALADGGWLATWQSNGQDGSGFGVYARRYASDGAAGAEFKVNQTTSDAQIQPSVTELAGGGFVVTWASMSRVYDYAVYGNYYSYNIYGRLFSASSEPVTGDFLISENKRDPRFTQQEPSVTALTDGGWVVVWQSDQTDGSGYGIDGRRYDASGNAGQKFSVNSYTAGNQQHPSVSALSDGGWVVTWESNGGNGYDKDAGIYYQRFSEAGVAVSTVYRVSSDAGSGVLYSLDKLYTLLDGDVDVTSLYSPSGSGLIGNGLSNVLTSNLVTNFADSLDGGAGNDTLTGGGGDDSYWVDEPLDVVVEGPDSGQDTVFSSATSYTLGENVEVLSLLGEQDIAGSGNGLDNLLEGNSGNNALSGLDGNDTIDGGAGSDSLYGGAGDDFYFVEDPDDVIVEEDGEGHDLVSASVSFTLPAGVEDITLTGGEDINATGNALDNLIIGNSADNSIEGGDGADSIYGGVGNDTLNGGAGVDLLVGGAGGDVYWVDDLADVIVEDDGGGIDEVIASLAAYTLPQNFELLSSDNEEGFVGTGNAVDNTLKGASGDDVLYGLLGNDTLYGGEGDDSLIGGIGDDSLIGGGGADSLVGGEGYDILEGGDGDDYYVITSDDISDVIVEDWGGGFDTVVSMVPTLDLRWPSEWAEVEVITLQEGLAYSVVGTNSNNYIVGNALNNFLDGGAGADTLAGGVGDDIYFVDSSSDEVIELEGEGYDGIRTLVDYTLPDFVEKMALIGYGSINGTGNALNNYILGNDAANVLDGATGRDTLVGGDGDDTYVIDALDDLIVENARQGIDTVVTGISFSLGKNFENLTLIGDAGVSGTGNELGNWIKGNEAANLIDGLLGVDTLEGGLGDDTYRVDVVTDLVIEGELGGEDLVEAWCDYHLTAFVENGELQGDGGWSLWGNQVANALVGNAADNLLSGGAGDDSLSGGLGNDTLVGGAGLDTAYFSGSIASYSISWVDQGLEVRGQDGVDRLLGVERIEFDDIVISGFESYPDMPLLRPFVSNDTLLEFDSGQPLVALDELRVNTYTVGAASKYNSLVSGLADGGWVVVWQSRGKDGLGESDVYAQRYSANGLAEGASFRLNTYTDSSQSNPHVVALSDGGWVATWESYGQDYIYKRGVYAQRFAADGSPVGNEYLVNLSANNDQWQPQVAALAGGGWVETYTERFSYSQNPKVWVVAYGPDGSRVATQSTTSTTGSLSAYPSVAGLADGGWVVTWSNQDTSYPYDIDIYGQRYAANAEKVGSAFLVNSYTSNTQAVPSVTATLDGGWVIVWQSSYQDGSNEGVYGQRYAADGTRSGEEFRVNSFTPNSQTDPEVTSLLGGGWVVTWESSGQTSDSVDVWARVYGSDGVVLGSEFRVNTFDYGSQFDPSIAALEDGGWVITWTSPDQGGIFFKRYDSTGEVVTSVADLYESPSVVALDGGGWVAAWHRLNAAGDGFEIVAATSDNDDSGLIVGESIVLQAGALNPRLGALPGGGWVAVWEVYDPETQTEATLHTRRFDAAGKAIGAVSTLVATNDVKIGSAAVQVLSGGGWVVAWQESEGGTREQGTYARQYSAAGTAIGSSDLYLGAETSLPDSSNPVAALADGGWLMLALSSEDSRDGVLIARRYDAAGKAVGSSFTALEYGLGTDTDFSVEGTADGGWVICWSAFDATDGVRTVVLQQFDAAGRAFGDVVEVGDGETGSQFAPQVAALPDGGWWVSWVNESEFGEGFDLLAQRFDPSGTPIGSLVNLQNTASAASLDVQDDGTVQVFWRKPNGILARSMLTEEMGSVPSTDNDLMFALTQDGVWEGGSGDDVYLVDSGADIIVELDDGGTDTIMSPVNYELPRGVERLILTGSDDIRGDGNEADNDVIGNEGDNVISGWAGDDTLAGGGGSDTLYGGEGDDHYLIDSANVIVQEYEDEGLDSVESIVSYGLPEFVENLLIRGSNLIGSGNQLDNLLTAIGGGNRLDGGFGSDTLIASGGDDTLIGGHGADVLQASGDGNYLEGGWGADTFRFLSLSGSTNTVKDFQAFDVLELTDLTSIASMVPGNGGLLTKGAVEFEVINGGTRVWIGLDTQRGADALIWLDGYTQADELKFAGTRIGTSLNRPPSAKEVGPVPVAEIDIVEGQVQWAGVWEAWDQDGDDLSYSLAGGEDAGNQTQLAHGEYGTLVLDTVTGSFTYTPDLTLIKPLESGGQDSFVLAVTDSEVQTSTTLYFDIEALNDAPFVVSDSANWTWRSGLRGQDIALREWFSDWETPDALTYEVVGLPAGLSLDVVSGRIVGELQASQMGTYEVSVVASDWDGLSIAQSMSLEVIGPGVSLQVSASAWRPDQPDVEPEAFLYQRKLANDLVELQFNFDPIEGYLTVDVLSLLDADAGSFQMTGVGGQGSPGLTFTLDEKFSDWTYAENENGGALTVLGYDSKGLAQSSSGTGSKISKGDIIGTFSGNVDPGSFRDAFSLLTVELGQLLYDAALKWSVFGSSDSGFEGLEEGQYALAASVDSDTSAALTAADAFEALKIALGVAQLERTVGPYELIAADVNQDGRVGVIDAYIIAQSALGKQVMPKRVLIDGDKDYSQMTSGSVSYEQVVDLGSLVEGAYEVDLIGIQLGDLLLPELLT